MSEEEKQAIKILEKNPKIIGDLDKELLEKMFEFKIASIETLKDWAIKIILNLTEKQQKEIEDSMPKQKIRDKIEDLEKIQKELPSAKDLIDIKIITLKELLETKEE